MSERNIVDRIFESRRIVETPNYKDMDDEELVVLAKNKDSRAVDTIIKKYEKLVRHVSKGLFLPGGDTDDLVQEGLLGLVSAIKDYTPGKNKNFQQFAILAAKRSMIDAVRSANAKKHTPMNKSDEYDTTLSTTVSDKSDPENKYLQKADKQRLMKYMKDNLTSWQLQVLGFYLQGYNYDEIAKKTNKDNKAINNAMNLVRSKLRKYKELYKESALVESILESIESGDIIRMRESYSILYQK